MAKICTVGLMVLLLCTCLVGSAYADVAPPDNGCDCTMSSRGKTIASPWLLAGVLITSVLFIRYRYRRR
jgi:hypothetical protein